MTDPDPDAASRQLAAESVADNDPTGWFERLYVAASEGAAVVPWDREAPSALLAEWMGARRIDGAGRRAIVVGCGLGRDAEFVASLGFSTVAFDVSETAIRTARERHAGSPVEYVTADLFNLPASWRGAYDLVVESMTVQSLPEPVRGPAVANISAMVAPGGTLIVIAVAVGEGDEPEPGPPWPLSQHEITAFASGEVQPVLVEDIRDAAEPAVHRWRAEFVRQPVER